MLTYDEIEKIIEKVNFSGYDRESGRKIILSLIDDIKELKKSIEEHYHWSGNPHPMDEFEPKVFTSCISDHSVTSYSFDDVHINSSSMTTTGAFFHP